MTRGQRLVWWALVTLALAGTLAMYMRPDFLVTLADQLWSCF
ncbi:hypothetical protein [Hydrogenophaga sp. 5NK40-0174]